MSRSLSASLLALTLSLGAPALSTGQVATPPPAPAPAPAPARPSPSTSPQVQAGPRRLDIAIAEALALNPVTAPYRIGVESRDGKIVLWGRVGGTVVHDAAVRTAIAYGASVSDQLITDTTGSYPLKPPAGPPMATAPGAGPNPGYPGTPYAAAMQGTLLSSYTYPPPLFGRYDEPFFGLEPPLSTFPAWWGEMSRVRLAQNAGPPPRTGQPAALPSNTVEATIDPYGVAVLRGIVPTLEDRIDLEQRLYQTPGVVRVINRLDVKPTVARAAVAANGRPNDDQPPPPPSPSPSRPATEPTEPAGLPIRVVPPPANPAPAANKPGLLGRIDRAIQDRPELTGKAIKVTVRDGIAYLSGKVPSAFEAMLAFRAVQQTPGVNSVADSLEFLVPDGTAPNPLLRANPEDVEPYLEAQVRRQVGDTSHLDRVRLQGDQLQVTGTVERPDDRPRVEAILRSMPLLRGFKIVPEFRPLDR